MPWAHVLDTAANDGPTAARRELESLARTRPSPLDRAFALKWAGQIALDQRDYATADRDFRAAMAASPASYDARWGALGLADIDDATQKYRQAEAVLAPLLSDPDAGIRVYARHREQHIRPHLRSTTLRWLFGFTVALAWGLALVRAYAAGRGMLRRMALPLAGFAMTGLALAWAVGRYATPLARPWCLIAALPGAALLSLSVTAGTQQKHWGAQGAWALVGLAGWLGMAYLAVDATWWAVR